MNPFIDIWDSFKTGTSGLSGRKTSAFWAITIVATALSFKFGNNSNVLELVLMWLVFGAICLGLVTIPELIKFLAELKNGKSINGSNEDISK